MLSKFIIDGLVYGHSIYSAIIDNRDLNFIKRDIDFHNRSIFVKGGNQNKLNDENKINKVSPSLTSSTPSKSVLPEQLDKSLKISWRYSYLKTVTTEDNESTPLSYQKEFLNAQDIVNLRIDDSNIDE